jgi:hypothetical protein
MQAESMQLTAAKPDKSVHTPVPPGSSVPGTGALLAEIPYRARRLSQDLLDANRSGRPSPPVFAVAAVIETLASTCGQSAPVLLLPITDQSFRRRQLAGLS